MKGYNNENAIICIKYLKKILESFGGAGKVDEHTIMELEEIGFVRVSVVNSKDCLVAEEIYLIDDQFAVRYVKKINENYEYMQRDIFVEEMQKQLDNLLEYILSSETRIEKFIADISTLVEKSKTYEIDDEFVNLLSKKYPIHYWTGSAGWFSPAYREMFIIVNGKTITLGNTSVIDSKDTLWNYFYNDKVSLIKAIQEQEKNKINEVLV